MANVVGLNLNWGINADGIQQLSKKLMEQCKAQCDQIASTTEFSYKTVLEPFNEMDCCLSNEVGFLSALENVSPDKAIRDAAHDAVTELGKFEIEIRMRKDLFDVLQKYSDSSNDILEGEDKRYVERSLIEGRLDGLHLDEQTRNRVKELKQKISELENAFMRNLNEEDSKFVFKREQLNGVSEDVINSFEKNDDGDYVVGLNYPSYFPIMKQCKVPDTRRKMLIEFNSRCVVENTPLLEEILQLRHELANVLSFSNFAEYSLKLCMAANPKNVDEFLNKLIAKLKSLLKTEHEILLNYKKEECEALNIPFDGKLRQHDITYYTTMREEKEFKI